MSYKVALKEKSLSLRKRGYSLKEISEKLSISKSTASLWLEKVTLSPLAQKRLEQKQILGQYKTILLKRQRREEETRIMQEVALTEIKSISISKELLKLFVSQK